MYDPKTPPPIGPKRIPTSIADLWNAIGVCLCVIGILWTFAWFADGPSQPWSGPPVFGYGLLFVILGKVSRRA